MDKRILDYYEQELLFLREMGKDFAQQFPKIAGRLSLDQIPCPDPYVERLLEGVAFLTARIDMKLDAQFPRFTQSLLETIYPQYLAPLPAMGIVEFIPDPREAANFAQGFPVPAGSYLDSQLGRDEVTACRFLTADPMKIFPLQIADVAYTSREMAAWGLPENKKMRAALRVRISSILPALTLDKIAADQLSFYISGDPSIQYPLHEQFFSHCIGVVVKPEAVPAPWMIPLDPTQLRPQGFADSEALLPPGTRTFAGYRLLREYFSLPHRFCFFTLQQLAPAMARSASGSLDIIFMFSQRDPRLENVLTTSNLRLSCTPVINLFEKTCSRIHLEDRFHEFHVTADVTRPLDYEIFDILRVTGYGAAREDQRDFQPFYRATDFDPGRNAYYQLRREPRVPSEKERRIGGRSQYAGSEVYISLVDEKNAPYATELAQLGVEALCTNRDLPLFLSLGRGPTDLRMAGNLPASAIRVIDGPLTSPRMSVAQKETAWRLISHLSLNYLSLTDMSPDQGAEALRSILRLYAVEHDAQQRAQIAGVRSVKSAPLHRRLIAGGLTTFVRGIEITVELDETAFQGAGAFLLGMILEKWFALHAPINSFTETVIRTTQRGQIIRWSTQPGRRPQTI